MKQAFQNLLLVSFLVLAAGSVSAQTVTPLQSVPIQETLPAAPVVTAPVTTTTTTTTLAPTMMDLYLQQAAAQEAALAAQATAAAETEAKSKQLAAGIQLAMKACPFFQEPAAKKIKTDSLKIQEAIGRDSNQSPDPTVSEKDKAGNRDSKGDAFVSKSCDSFINENGEYGALGNKILAGIRENPESFSSKVPTDMKSICPKYSSMDEEQRNKFWVWTMMSMASTESSCDSEKVNQDAPNGAATGLFQLSADVCGKDVDLVNAMQNADCAVNRMASELKNRSKLISTTALGENGTYWAAICIPKKGSKDCGDNKDAGKKTLTMIRKYSECGYSAAAGKKPGSGKKRGTASQ
ncbi:hypothetical protein [Bdellovibrio sp. HCB274]|uniref:hypothetical protein n=1 Tax=Bdellovibrio sp. HCB274 TaxID=3394361 RepID=UPI0039B58A1C